MPRPIRFRYWNRKEKKMYSWFALSNVSFPIEFADLEKANEGSLGEMAFMQFTGLHDKDGEEIYEGDIIRHADEFILGSKKVLYKDLVEWNDRACGFYPFANDGSDCNIHTLHVDCEIIGNIHENPEIVAKRHHNPRLPNPELFEVKP